MYVSIDYLFLFNLCIELFIIVRILNCTQDFKSLTEFGPRHRGKVELGVREVPEEKIAQALLSAGANEEVRGLGEGTLR